MERQHPVAISLFAGAGGCSLGFGRAGYNIVHALDSDPVAVRTYGRNFPGSQVEVSDARMADWPGLARRLGLAEGELDMLIGGPPCQGFSTAGARRDDPRNLLLGSYMSALGSLRPKWFLMENVEGLLTTKSGDYLLEATRAIIDLGYTLRVEKVYAHEYGVPQRRKRVLVFGNRLGLEFGMPTPSAPATGSMFRKGSVTLRDVISPMPPATVSDTPLLYRESAASELEAYYRDGCDGLTDHYAPPMSDVQQDRIKALCSGQAMKDLPPELQHASFMRRANRRVRDGIPTERRGGAPNGLKRLFYDEPCLTITGASTREFIHPTENRPLTIRECARVQTFPDAFLFDGSAAQRIQQVGNAVPPLLAEVMGRHIMAFGFEGSATKGELIGFSLTKASAMSPALARTHSRLQSLCCNQMH